MGNIRTTVHLSRVHDITTQIPSPKTPTNANALISPGCGNQTSTRRPDDSLPPSLLLATAQPQDDVHDDGGEKKDGKDRGTKAVVKASLTSLTNASGTPMESEQGVEHGDHGHEGEETGADPTDIVTKVEQADGETAQDDGEVQPAEEGAFVGEEDLGFDSSG